jgi:hypothetical protein
MSSVEIVCGNLFTLYGEFLSTPDASSQEIVDSIWSEVASFDPLPVRESFLTTVQPLF